MAGLISFDIARSRSPLRLFTFAREKKNEPKTIRKPQAKVTELLKPVPSPSPRARSHDRVAPRSGASRQPFLSREFYSFADRNGNATFEPPINHRANQRSDLRRLRRREYISVGVYIRACWGFGEAATVWSGIYSRRAN